MNATARKIRITQNQPAPEVTAPEITNLVTIPQQAAIAAPPVANVTEETEHPAIAYLEGLFYEEDFIFFQLIHAARTHEVTNKKTGETVIDKKTGQPRMAADARLLPLVRRADASTPEYMKQLEEFQAQGWNIFVCMNPFPEGTKTRTEDLIVNVCNLFLDVDKTKENGDRALQLIEAAVKGRLIPQPTSILESSPGNYHITWAVEDFTPAQAKAMLPVLASRLGGDMAAIDLNRVLRLPGFKNLKKERGGFTCRLVSSLFGEAEPYMFSDFKLPIVVEERKKTKPSPEAVEQTVGYMVANAAEAKFELGNEENRADGGVGWIVECPWAHLHTEGGSTALLMVLGDGRPEFNCFHGHCNGVEGPQRGWSDIRNLWKEKVGHFQRFGPEDTKSLIAFKSGEENKPIPAAGKKDDGYALNFKWGATQIGEEGDYDFVLGPSMGASEGWCPRGDVHIIAGPSGGSKTTFVVDILETQRHRQKYLGHESFGLPYLIVMADRGVRNFRRTMKRMGIDHKTVPISRLRMTRDAAAIQAIRNKIEECDPLPAVVFVEGADLLVKDASKPEVVTPFLNALQEIAEHYHISLIVSVGSPKQKVGEGYVAKRDQVIGTIFWGRMSETIITMQYLDGDDTDSRRVVSVLLRNSPAERYRMIFKDGRLVPDNEPLPSQNLRPSLKDLPRVVWYRQQPGWFTVSEFAEALQLKKSQTYQVIQDDYTRKILRSKKNGGEARQYRWNDEENNPAINPVDLSEIKVSGG